MAAVRRGQRRCAAARRAHRDRPRRRHDDRAGDRAQMTARTTRGAALIIAMVIAALAAAVAVSLAAGEQQWLSSMTNRRDQVQAQALALAGVQCARHILFEVGRTT